MQLARLSAQFRGFILPRITRVVMVVYSPRTLHAPCRRATPMSRARLVRVGNAATPRRALQTWLMEVATSWTAVV
jgi:hypothetical protein